MHPTQRSLTSKSGLFLIGTFVLIAVASCSEKTKEPLKPNILFIAIDDMNDWTTLFDEKNPISTPNLVRLAKRGTFFSQAYCAVPACTPSRTAILTGYNPTTSGSYRNGDFLREVLPDAVILPGYFRENGYQAKQYHHCALGNGNHAVRSVRWRYIRYSDGTEELYDHQNDPWEWTNLASRHEVANVIAEHKS